MHMLSLVVNFNSVQESQEAALMGAAKEGRVGMVRKLIQQRVDMNLTGKVMDLSGGYGVYTLLFLYVWDKWKP